MYEKRTRWYLGQKIDIFLPLNFDFENFDYFISDFSLEFSSEFMGASGIFIYYIVLIRFEICRSSKGLKNIMKKTRLEPCTFQ